MKYYFFLLTVAIALSGCGGGGSSDSPGGSGDGSGASSGSDASNNTATFDQVIIPEGFNLKSFYPVTLNIDLNTDETMYLSVYGNHSQASNGDIVADSSSRIIASKMNNGQFKGRFTATSGLSSVLVEAWYYDGTRLPFRQIIELPQETITIQN